MSYNKAYYENNKDKIKEYKQRTIEKKISNGTFDDEINKRKEYSRNYYNDNKDYFIEYNKKRKETLRNKIECECGSTISKGSLYSHRKSEKHINRIIIKQQHKLINT